MVAFQISGFSMQKAGNKPEEYEDAWASCVHPTRIAVSDGATDSFESGRWSRTLVEHVIVDPPRSAEDMLGWVAAPIKTWKAGINWNSLPWYGTEKANRGAFATLLTVEFEDSLEAQTDIGAVALRYLATAVGDACLFHVQDDQLIVRFPLSLSTDFGTMPPLLSTRDDYNGKSLESLKTLTHDIKPGDVMLLATDALAAWFLRDFEDGGKPWLRLHAVSHSGFEELVHDLRQEKLIHNDDVTLVVISVGFADSHPTRDQYAEDTTASSQNGY